MPSDIRRNLSLRVVLPLSLLACCLAGLAGCGKEKPEPTVPGYYEGPIKPKNDVAPGPGGAEAKPGAKGASVGE
jgi:hypothetical protein